ncbi:MAG: cell division protein FtsL [Bacilli bacterium]|nr:cell division protein FtsL [Bacilli bacterium]
MKEKKNIKRDKRLFILIVLVLVFSPLLQVITRAKLSEINIDVEKIKTNIEKQEKLNESINMQINELASLDKIRQIADKNGLSYKNNNITSID